MGIRDKVVSVSAAGGALALALGCGLAGQAHAQAAEGTGLAPAERAAIFEAAGAHRRGAAWAVCAEDPTAPEARIEELRDLNGDGRPEAVVMEDGSFCNGAAGVGYRLVSRQADGRWKRIDGGSGIPEFLDTRGADGWPDLSVGGPGFCFPVLRWNGSEYALHRHEYQGRPCQAQ